MNNGMTSWALGLQMNVHCVRAVQLKNSSAAPNFGARGFYTKSLSRLSQFVTANKDDRVSRQL